MMMNRKICPLFWAVALLPCTIAGCWLSVPLPIPDIEQDGALFAEDEDPAVAALPFVEKELLVQPYPGAEGEAVAALYAQVGAVVIEELTDIDATVLAVPADERDVIATQLADTGLIETVQKNYLYEPSDVPNDPMYRRQSHLTQVAAAQAWDTTVGDENIIIAIVDTGIDRDHPDLVDRIVDGWNAYNGNFDYSDVHGHGTQVAGVVAAATNNQLGVAGMTWECPIVVVRVSDQQGRASARHIAAGILWAVNHGASVINISFAPLWSNRVVRAAATEAFNRGAVVVISTGNAGQTSSASGYAEAMFVGAVNSSNEITSFSDRGGFVDLVAPGIAIRTTKDGGEYTMANGTSFAAPIVSGVAALAWSVNPDLRPVTVASALQDTAVDLGATGKDTSYGYGLVDAAAAVDGAAQLSFVPDTTPPTLTINRPSNGATLTGRYAVYVTASDRWGVADVVMSVDGMAYATDTRSPYWLVIDIAKFPSGWHQLSFVATDHAGNASEPTTIRVNFRHLTGDTTNTATEIRFTYPANGATVTRDTTIRATISDTDGLATIEWFVDGIPVHTSTVSGQSTGVSYMWRIVGYDPGSHTISLIVTDLNGDQTTDQLTLRKR